ncbi:transposase-like protein [Bradyrhizobium sp. i1.4.4]
MKPSRFTEEQIIGILREQETGATTGDVCRKHGISSATFYKWKAKYGGLEVSDAKRLKGAGGRERQAQEAVGRDDARQRHAQGRHRKTMVTPAARREAVAHLRAKFEVSERRACTALGVDRTSVRYRSRRPDDPVCRARLRELATVRRRFGYRRLHVC